LDNDALNEKIQKGRQHSRFQPVRVKRDIDFPTLSALEERLYLLPGVSYDVESKRKYFGPIRASHLFGYCKEISDAQLTRLGQYYRQGDLIGSSGLEWSYETFLRGEKGFEFIAVNSKGQAIGPWENGTRDIDSKEGFDLILGIDAGTQAIAESLMAPYVGALVAMDPKDGSIIAMVSKPDFEPSIFSGVTPTGDWVRLNTDPAKPLFNRATMTRYPPGSTLKMLLALAALQEGVIDENYRITCGGGFRFGRRLFKDLHVHGSTGIIESIQKSCNVFYYQLVLKVGLEKWAAYARRFGFGSPSGIDMSEETAGLIPSGEYYDRVYGKGKWTQGFVVSLGIGQGEVGVSPLQMARYASALANGGIVYQPHAVLSIHSKRTHRLDAVDHPASTVNVDKRWMDMIREGMRRCVMEPGGTASLARIAGIQVAGKTGTAQNPHGEDHAWFVGFAPFEDPKIAVAVMVENQGYGGVKAAPLAGMVMEKYLFGEIRRGFKPQPAAKKDSTKIIAHVR
ncbi:MAG: penicillin-binding protein 2, partial [Ignavibacteriales bacterium]|nr:penicillin-binding protein 2 [Ignavibacteriales bacterium]